MNRNILAMCIGLLMGTLSGAVAAAPVPYSFSTGTLSGNSFFLTAPLSLNAEEAAAQQAISTGIAAQLAATSVSGSFVYDNAAPRTGSTMGGTIGDRGTIYGGHLRLDGSPIAATRSSRRR